MRDHRRSGRKLRPCTCASVLAVVLLFPTAAAAQTIMQDQTDSGALDFFRPPPNLFQMMYGYRTAPGSGSTTGTTREVTTETLNLRYDHAFDLSSGWVLVSRSDLPLLAKDPLSMSNPNGDYLYGIGDVDAQAALIRNIGLPDRWYVTFYPSPDIRVNFGDPITGQTGRWFIPFDIRVGKKLSETIALSLEAGVPILKDYPVYDFKTQVRLNATW